MITSRGARVARSVQSLSLDFGSGQDLPVPEIEPGIGLCADMSLLGILSLPARPTPDRKSVV